jgi:hypothetical protein
MVITNNNNDNATTKLSIISIFKQRRWNYKRSINILYISKLLAVYQLRTWSHNLTHKIASNIVNKNIIVTRSVRSWFGEERKANILYSIYKSPNCSSSYHSYLVSPADRLKNSRINCCSIKVSLPTLTVASKTKQQNNFSVKCWSKRFLKVFASWP